MSAVAIGRVAVYGGKGGLGSHLVSHFKAKNFWVLSIGKSANEEADANCIVDALDSWTDQETQVLASVKTVVGDNKLDAILCVAGGWAGGSAKAKSCVKNADLVWKQSVWTSSIAVRLAVNHLSEGGLLALSGSLPCTEGTPSMIGYGMAKAAVHQLTKSLAEPEKAGLPAGSVSLAILPVILDTPNNRKWMQDADTSTWTSLSFVADLFERWTMNQDRPSSGSLVKIVTTGGATTVIPM